jgi:glyoxylase-like metal-dependent hydrolase (beta-lactamase superfamily II)
MKYRVGGWLLVLGVMLSGAVVAQDDRFAKVTIKTTAVAGSVYMLEGAGGNIGVSVGVDGVLIIDDQFLPLADRIKAAIAKIGAGKTEWLLNTHFHGDHTGGNPAFHAEARIVSHDNVRKRLAEGSTVAGRETPPGAPEMLPVLTFNDQLTLHFNGEALHVMHFPHAHTDGDIAIWFSSAKVAHLGDMFFAGRFPFVDIDSGGSVDGLIAGIEKILAMLPDDAKIIPGHGPLSGKSELASYLAMLRDTSAIVREAKAAGKTLEEVKKAGFGETYEAWGEGFISTERWAGTLWKSF